MQLICTTTACAKAAQKQQRSSNKVSLMPLCGANFRCTHWGHASMPSQAARCGTGLLAVMLLRTSTTRSTTMMIDRFVRSSKQ